MSQLLTVVLLMSALPQFSFAATLEYQYDSFFCRYFNVVLKPFGGCVSHEVVQVSSPVVHASLPVALEPTPEALAVSAATSTVIATTSTTTTPAENEGASIYKTYVTNNITNPTQVVRELAATEYPTEPGISKTLFYKQTDKIFDTLGESIDDAYDYTDEVFDDLSDSFLTDDLTVAGSVSFGGVFRDSTDSAGVNGMILQTTSTGTLWVSTSTLGLGGSAGTVSSVALSVPTGFTASGSPVTTSGTLALAYAAGYTGLLSASSTNWNSFYNAPSTRITAGAGLGWVGNTLNINTTGDWTGVFDGQEGSYYLSRTNQTGTQATSTITGVFAALQGGTGLSNYTVGDMLFASASTTLSTRSIGTTGQVLQVVGGVPAWVATSSLGISGGGYSGGALTVDGLVNISTVMNGYQIGGTNVLYASSTNSSTMVGLGAGSALKGTGIGNTAVGEAALGMATSSGYNTAVGAAVLASNTSGSENTATGYSALTLNRTGSYNTVAGYNALYNNTTGLFNAVFGHNSLYNNTVGAFNTTIGASAGFDLNTATSTGVNTFVGYNTGRGIVTGIKNTIIGANVTGLASSLSNHIIIADGDGNQRILVDNSGNVGIGSTTPSARLSVVGSLIVTGTSTLATTSITNLVLTQALGVTSGGTGLTSTSQYQLLIGGAGNTWSQIGTSSLGLSASFSNSIQLAALLSDETGTGTFVLADSPTFTGTAIFGNTTNTGTLSVTGTTTLPNLMANRLVVLGTSSELRATTSGITATDVRLSVAGVTGSGNLVFDTSPILNQPMAAILRGGTANNSILRLRSTSGPGVTDAIIFETGSSTIERGRISTGGQWSIGTTSSTSLLTVAGTTLISGTSSGALLTVQGSSSFDGNVGIGTSTPSAQLTTTGTVRLANFGAGSLQTDANGNLSVSSDERLKDIQSSYDAGLEEVLGLEPILYRWNKASGLETASVYAGFSAQNVRDYLPEAVGEDSRGYLTLSDRGILAAVVNSIKDIWTTVTGIQTDVADLKAENANLKARLQELESEVKQDNGGEREEEPQTIPVVLPADDPQENTPPADTVLTPVESDSIEVPVEVNSNAPVTGESDSL